MNILCLEHVSYEGPGRIADWVARRGHTLQRRSLAAGDSLPAPSAVDFLIIMGGPMNIYQHRDHPWLVEEKQFIADFLKLSRPALGICLGAQFLADALGGRVFQNPYHELGWFPLTVHHREGLFADWPPELTVLHWHGETFSLPPGATGVASSEACRNQAFVWEGRVVGLQFHLEIDPATIKALCDAGHLGSWSGPHVQTPEVITSATVDYAPVQMALDGILDGLVTKIKGL